MNRIIKLFSTLLLGVFLLSACQQEILKEKTNEEIIKGKILGSETEITLVKELIKHANIDTLNDMSVIGGGSKTGIEKLILGEALMANSSIKITNEEKSKLKEKGKHGLIEIIFAGDAVAVITNSTLGVDSLSVFQLKKIFKGEITNWKEVGGPDLIIQPYRRNENSGTHEFFWNKVVQGNYASSIIEVNNNEELLQNIETNKGGIGYLGVGTIKNAEGKPSDKVWAVNIYIEGDQPKSPYSFLDVVYGSYYLSRPLYQYFLYSEKDLFEAFINFELSEKGQQIVKEFGFYPITEEQWEANQQVLDKLKSVSE